jgi:hypothetical protein
LREAKENEAIVDVEHVDGSVVMRKVRVQPTQLPPGRNRADWARLGQETGEKIVIKPKPEA